jgi:hypothetical protein
MVQDFSIISQNSPDRMPEERKRFHLVVIRNQCSPKPQRKDFHKWPFPVSSKHQLRPSHLAAESERRFAKKKHCKNVLFFLAEPQNRMFALGLRTFSTHELSASAKDLLFQAFHSKSFR